MGPLSVAPSEGKADALAGENEEPFVQKASRDTLNLIALQLINRSLAFALKALILRLSTLDSAALVNGRLTLLASTVEMVSTGGMRIALLRLSQKSNAPLPLTDVQSLGRLFLMGTLPIVLAAPVAGLICLVFHLSASLEGSPPPALWQLYMAINAAAFVCEIALEPFCIYATLRGLSSDRLRVEVVASTARAVAVLAMVAGGSGAGEVQQACKGMQCRSTLQHLAAFTLGNVVRLLALAVGWLIVFKRRSPVTLSKVLGQIDRRAFDGKVFAHATAMTGHTLLKYFLAHGDAWVISLAAPLGDQGVHSIATGYGSLACRVLLAPMEEIALATFSSAASEEESPPTAKATLAGRRGGNELPPVEGQHSDGARIRGVQKPTAGAAGDSATIAGYLELLLKADQVIAGLAVCFGSFLTTPLVAVLFGPSWQASDCQAIARALSAHCYLVAAMAFSGIFEAFSNATMGIGGPSLQKHHGRILMASAIYIGLAIPLTRAFGAVGLIAASTCAFTIRAVLAGYHTAAYFAKRGVPLQARSIALPPQVYAAFLAGALANFSMERAMPQAPSAAASAPHVAVAIAGLGGVALAMHRYSRDLASSLAGIVSARKAKRI